MARRHLAKKRVAKMRAAQMRVARMGGGRRSCFWSERVGFWAILVLVLVWDVFWFWRICFCMFGRVFGWLGLVFPFCWSGVMDGLECFWGEFILALGFRFWGCFGGLFGCSFGYSRFGWRGRMESLFGSDVCFPRLLRCC